MADLEDKPYDPEREAWTRRRFLKAAGLVAAGAAAVPILEACGGGGGGGGGALTTGKAPVPRQGASIRLLQWVHFVPAADTEFIRQCTEFGTKYGVTVAVERITADQLIAKTAADVESNSGPDIIQMQYGWPHLYDAACVDVSNEVGILKSKLGAVASVNDAFCKVNGVYKAIPYTIVPNAFTYRTDLLSQAGVTSWPKTWTEFAAAAAKMKAANLQPFAQTDGHAYGDSLTMWNPVLWSHGATEVKADGKTVTINSKETRAAIAWAQNAVKGGFVVHPEWLDPDNNQAYHANRISATLNGASIYIREKVEFHHYDSVSDNGVVPAGPKGLYTMNLIFNHAVMKWSPEKETAKALIMYLMDKTNYLKYTDIAGGYNAGPFAAFDNDPVWTKDPKMKAFHDVVATGKWPGWPATPSKQTAQSQQQYIVADMFAKAIANGDTESAVKEAESRLQAIFSRPG
ncbi:MAG: carbohydrate ABC transporter substrate-binding protein [Chloroflexi bacterium]|nr:MAG: carbohydrate ABC transporter substrate-binding protein [Chloroflexota bacterium]